MHSTRLILINGAPGSGKSSIAAALAHDDPAMVALDVDRLKHALPAWDRVPIESGIRAREQALDAAEVQLRAGLDVVLGQYLARTAFIEALELLAHRCGARFAEFVLELGAEELAARLEARIAAPDRPEHAVNNRLVGATDADALVASLEPLHVARPNAVWIDASGSLPVTVGRVRDALPDGGTHRRAGGT
ncbi:AAA family ATPase [Tsukamurella ocularis]|uniref:AAA family ATPase n=1 Tax=Tsukamurella ocularis TaxID=1970234 RepID=UPI0039F09A2B